jgi:tRNA(Glu) U13 pseudouridine synthase TruD
MQELGVSSDQMTCAAHAPTGDRRALRAAVRAASIESGVDEHGGFFLLRFELPAGSFATTLLREVLGSVEEAAHDSN